MVHLMMDLFDFMYLLRSGNVSLFHFLLRTACVQLVGVAVCAVIVSYRRIVICYQPGGREHSI